MSWTPKIITTLAVALGVVVLAIWLGVFGKSSPPPPLPPPPDGEIKTAKTNPGRFFTPRGQPRPGSTNGAAVSVSVTSTN